MYEPTLPEARCGCCHAVLHFSAEIKAGVCDACLMIALRPWEYEGDPDIDATWVKSRVDQIVAARIHKRARRRQAA